MAMNKRQVENSLLSKGFEKKEGAKHKHFVYVTTDGKKTIVKTLMSRSRRPPDLSFGLLSIMANQCKLSKAEFEELVGCPLSRAAYEERLAEQSLL